MADTKIEWTDKSWSPVVGCTKVSPGCENCYAERMAKRLSGMESSRNYKKKQIYRCKYSTHIVNSDGWTGNIVCDESALDKPLHWRTPRQIFVCSMGDLLHKSVPFEFTDKVIEVLRRCPQHTGILLTKRHERMLKYSNRINRKWPDNIIGMVTAENQKWADIRIPALLQCGFKTTGVSIEPMLGEIDIKKYVYLRQRCVGKKGCGFTGASYEFWNPKKDGAYRCPQCRKTHTYLITDSIDWVIVGGESGLGARPMHPAWARSIRDQCKDAGVPFFFKQWGKFVAPEQTNYQSGGHGRNKEWRFPVGCSYLKYDGTYYPGYPSGGISAWTKIYGIGKKKAGCLLDGKEHKEYPENKP